ncbi:hypothetical protein D3C83_279240 [compost metagenome]
MAGKPQRRRFSMELPLAPEPGVLPGDEAIHKPKPGVMPGFGVLLARVTEPDKEFRDHERRVMPRNPD